MNAENIDLTEFRKFTVQLMPAAGEILKGHFNSGSLKFELKNPKDLVTQADMDVDDFLRQQIRQRFPVILFLTEETAPNDYSRLRDAENLCVIDSLDGSWNFFTGNPNFAVSVALVNRAVARVGIVYVPMVNKLYYAQEDQAAVVLNDKPVKGPANTANLDGCNFACDWVPANRGRERTLELFLKVVNRVGPIKSMGSAVADLASLTEGRIDAYLNCGLKPWDVAAVSLLIEKAGGRITTPEGTPWNVFEPDIFASNLLLHPQFIQAFKQR